ncbi:MAG: hypothetical protein RI580_14775 [Halothece sp. Uz-M2-17]|nr:hypothetical protein [Halothece sp. Uz-M2-17]
MSQLIDLNDTIPGVEGNQDDGFQADLDNDSGIQDLGENDVIRGSDGSDRVSILTPEGTGASVELGGGDDSYNGTPADEENSEIQNRDVDGGDGNDTIQAGGQEAANFSGGTGDDLIVGGRFADTLTGDAGDDTIQGGSGDDTIKGGEGADTLTGGPGADVFQYELADLPDEGSDATDLITDFDVNEDTLEFGEDIDTDLLSVAQEGDNAVISYDGTEIIELEDVDSTEDDFEIF